MATGAQRDEGALTEGLRRWAAADPETVRAMAGGAAGGAVGGAVGGAAGGASGRSWPVLEVRHAPGGLANETLLVDLGPGHRGLAVRLPPLEPTYPDYELGPQAVVQGVVAAAGVPAPSPAVVVEEPAWIGTPFLVMPRVAGDVPGPAPLFDPYVRGAGAVGQRQLHEALIDVMASVHAVDWRGPGLAAVLPGATAARALARWTAYTEWASGGDPLPVLRRVLEWCAARLPEESGPPVLLWGDVRLGNLVFAPDRSVRAVLDWDLAGIGPPEMDLGWHLGLDHLMEGLFGARPPGFCTRGETLERYERRTGRAPCDVGWHEVFALARALAVSDRHRRITGAPPQQPDPMGEVVLARMEEVAAGG